MQENNYASQISPSPKKMQEVHTGPRGSKMATKSKASRKPKATRRPLTGTVAKKNVLLKEYRNGSAVHGSSTRNASKTDLAPSKKTSKADITTLKQNFKNKRIVSAATTRRPVNL